MLGIDTSFAAAVGVAGIVRQSEDPRGQVEQLSPLIAEALQEANLQVSDLSAIAAGTGPAPYTGLRIGLATARALAFALGIPVWGVPALDALAADAAARLSPPPGSRILAALDAKRRETYWALYLAAGAAPPRLTEGPAVGPPTSVPPADVVAAGGSEEYRAALCPTPGTPDRVNPLVVVELAVLRAAQGLAQPSDPVYLRRPDIAPPAPRKRVTR